MTLPRISPPGSDEHARQQWQLTFDLTSNGIALLDPRTGRMERVNPAFARMHGGSPQDFAGRPIATTLTAEWQTRIPEIVPTVHDAGSRRLHCHRVRLDGSTFPTTTDVVAARSPRGELLYRLVFVTDLTELRAREATEERAVQRFRCLFEKAPVGMVLLRDGVIEGINAAAQTILGGCAQDFVGVDHRLIRNLPDALLSPHALAAGPNQVGPPPQDLRIKQDDGSYSYIRYTAAILEEGLVLLLIEDRTAEVLGRAAEEQIRLIEDRDRIAHDLHDNAIQHLFAIGMTVQSIVAALPDSPQAHRLGRTLEQIDSTIRGIRGVIHALQPSAVSFGT